MAAASGIALVGGAEGNHAVDASSKGTGQLIHKAIDLGAKEIVVGVGGSACTDGGSGAVLALEPAKMTTIGVSIIVACDVRIAFLDAAAIFARPPPHITLQWSACCRCPSIVHFKSP